MGKLAVFLGGLLVASTAVASGAKFLTLEEATMAQAKRWQQTGVAKPIMSDDGKILFPFGQYMPTVVCTPLRACDIELEAGENLTGKPLAGDKVRWHVSLIESGSGDSRRNHIVVKPLDVSLETNLIIATDRRSYHIRLSSPEKEGDYLHRVGFYYPEQITQDWDQRARVAEREAKHKERTVVAELPSIAIDKMDFAYTVEGNDPAITPVRVFNQGTHVILQMPGAMRVKEAPVLLLYDKDDKLQVVNYRVKGRHDDEPGGGVYFVVDKLFDKAVLLAGTGNAQSKVVITYGKTEKKSKWLW